MIICKDAALEALMSVRFWTSNARGLLRAFAQAVRDGTVTWEHDAAGLLTHKSLHLKNKACVRPKIYQDSLAFAIVQNEDIEISKQLYGMYQACLMQTFLSHFADQFTLVDASSDFRSRDGDLGLGGIPMQSSRPPQSLYFKSFVPERRTA